MKTYQIKDLEKVFNIDLKNASLGDVVNAYQSLEQKLEDGFQRGWIDLTYYAKSLKKAQDMRDYLFYAAITRC